MGGLHPPKKGQNNMHIINVIHGVGFWLCMISLVVYKLNVLKTKSWEETIYMMFRKGFEVCYEEITGKTSPKRIVDSSLFLTNGEVLELVHRFDNRPYEVPALGEYLPNANGISWMDIRAIELIPKYANMKTKEIALMAYHIIQDFYMEKRGTSVRLYIKVATPQRLYFAIALSEEGFNFLEEQQSSHQVQDDGFFRDVPLEEEIDIYDEPQKENSICK